MIISEENITTEQNTGIFDKIMAGVDRRVDSQYKLQRLSGNDFATVYVGAIQAALQESVKFLQVQAANEIALAQSTADLALKRSQKDLAEQQTIKERYNSTIAENQSIASQHENAIAEEKKRKLTAETNLLDKKILTEVTQETVLNAQKGVYAAQKNGFKFKATVDACKVLSDAWITGSTSAAGVFPDPTDPGIGGQFCKMATEIYAQADNMGEETNDNEGKPIGPSFTNIVSAPKSGA